MLQRILRWMYGRTRKDHIQNDHIRERVEVAPIMRGGLDMSKENQ